VRVCSKRRYLAWRIATIGTVRVGLKEFPDREAVRGPIGVDGDMLAHERSPGSIHLRSIHLRTARASIQEWPGKANRHNIFVIDSNRGLSKPRKTFLFGKTFSTFTDLLKYQFELLQFF
jgi:hypothetical protein